MFQRKSTLAVLLGLIFLSFFGTLAVSAWMFPQNYDWRYRVISNLLSPRDNPAHYWLAAIGLAVTALLMLPFAGHLRRHLEVASPRVARMSSGAFAAASGSRFPARCADQQRSFCSGNYRTDLRMFYCAAAHA